MIMKKILLILLSTLILLSCTDSKRKETIALLQEWEGKEVVFPSNPIFTIKGEDTVDYQIQNKCKILTYIDSTGCTSCKLRLSDWKNFISEVDSIRPHSIQFLFFLCPQSGMEIYQALRVARFNYPICIDEKDSLNKLNKFPSEMTFQTFLLDETNKVVAMGNPVHNLKVRELYLKIIQGKEVKYDNVDNAIQTSVVVDKTFISMSTFDWRNEQRATFVLENIGDKPLVIEGIDTSCGCISVEYSQEPIRPGMNLTLSVIYKAEHPEHFSKTVTVHCNSESSPIKLTVSGNAQ